LLGYLGRGRMARPYGVAHPKVHAEIGDAFNKMTAEF
jgi:hypothetical protein